MRRKKDDVHMKGFNSDYPKVSQKEQGEKTYSEFRYKNELCYELFYLDLEKKRGGVVGSGIPTQWLWEWIS